MADLEDAVGLVTMQLGFAAGEMEDVRDLDDVFKEMDLDYDEVKELFKDEIVGSQYAEHMPEGIEQGLWLTYVSGFLTGYNYKSMQYLDDAVID